MFDLLAHYLPKPSNNKISSVFMHFCLISNDLGQNVLTLRLDTTKVDLRPQDTS